MIIVGMNHNSAPLTVRERVAVSGEQLVDALLDARAGAGLDEIVILSTCNRTELVCVTDGQPRAEVALGWLGRYHHLEPGEIGDYCYVFEGTDAVKHLIEVACGLDSMVVGEPQILGQLKSAFTAAQEHGTVGSVLDHAFQHCFAFAKRVRSETAIGANPVSVAYAAVDLSRHLFADLKGHRALLIGAGETMELVARHLRDSGVRDIVVANRTLGRARELAAQFEARAVLLSEIPDELRRADIVISSTGSQLPILGKGAVESAMKVRRHQPIFMVDIAVPRDIEPEVGELRDVYLYSIDDLRGIVEENMRNRRSEADKAQVIVEEAVSKYSLHLKSLDVVSTVKAFRQKAETIRDAEIERALRSLERGDATETVLRQLARSLTNKLIHAPTVTLKKAGIEGRREQIAWVRELFELGRDGRDRDDHE